MALSVLHDSAGSGLVSDRRLYLDSSREFLCEDGSPTAAWLLAPAGSVIAAADVARLGLKVLDGRIVQDSAAAVPATVAAPSTPEPPPVAENAPAEEPTPRRRKKNGE